MSFPVEKDPGGADGAPEGVEEEGPIRLPCQGQYKSGFNAILIFVFAREKNCVRVNIN